MMNAYISHSKRIHRKAERAEEKILSVLGKKNKTLAVAESCTGGLVAHRITNIPGSSSSFLGGIVAYSNDVKVSALAVPAELIGKHGAVSRQVARSMAEGVRKALNADVAAAVTGIAGPGGGSVDKPVGLAFIALSSGKTQKTKKVMIEGGRIALKLKFAQAVLEFLRANV